MLDNPVRFLSLITSEVKRFVAENYYTRYRAVKYVANYIVGDIV